MSDDFIAVPVARVLDGITHLWDTPRFQSPGHSLDYEGIRSWRSSAGGRRPHAPPGP